MITREMIEAQRKLYSQPVCIGNQFAIRVLTPRNRHFSILDGVTIPGKVMVDIDPGFVFGDGVHGTTQMCATAMERYARSGMKVLDVGCGTGIQSIVALLLGARQVTARDIDPAAVQVAMKNAARNGVADRFAASTGNLADGVAGTFDVIVANILADPILALLPSLPALVDDHGVVILSGIHEHRAEEVATAARQAFAIVDQDVRDGFVYYALKKRV